MLGLRLRRRGFGRREGRGGKGSSSAGEGGRKKRWWAAEEGGRGETKSLSVISKASKLRDFGIKFCQGERLGVNDSAGRRSEERRVGKECSW